MKDTSGRSNYELLLYDYVNFVDKKLYRMRAIRDFENRKGVVKKGELGGFIEGFDNVSGNGWITNDSLVFGNAYVKDYCIVSGSSVIHDKAKILGKASIVNSRIHEEALIEGRVTIKDSVISGRAVLLDDVIVDDSIVTDSARIGDRMQIVNKSIIMGNVLLFGNKTISKKVLTMKNITGSSGLMSGLRSLYNNYVDKDKHTRLIREKEQKIEYNEYYTLINSITKFLHENKNVDINNIVRSVLNDSITIINMKGNVVELERYLLVVDKNLKLYQKLDVGGDKIDSLKCKIRDNIIVLQEKIKVILNKNIASLEDDLDIEMAIIIVTGKLKSPPFGKQNSLLS